MLRRIAGFAGFAAIIVACADGTSLTDPAADPGNDADGGTTADTGTTPAHDASTSDASASNDAAGSSDAGKKPDAAPVNLSCGKVFDFDKSDGAFTHIPMDSASGSTFDPWSYGEVAGGCHTGTKCFSTDLSGPYSQCQRAELRSPVIDLSSCAGAHSIQVTFWHAYDFLAYVDAGGATFYDGGILELSGDGGNTWQTAITSPPSVGNLAIAAHRGIIGQYTCPGPASFYVDGKSGFINKNSGWESFEADVPQELRTSQFMFRFAFASGKSTADTNVDPTTKGGWHVDDVGIYLQ